MFQRTSSSLVRSGYRKEPSPTFLYKRLHGCRSVRDAKTEVARTLGGGISTVKRYVRKTQKGLSVATIPRAIKRLGRAEKIGGCRKEGRVPEEYLEDDGRRKDESESRRARRWVLNQHLAFTALCPLA
jgi:hypothetical protein